MPPSIPLWFTTDKTPPGVRPCGLRLGRPERPDDRVLPGREMEERFALEGELVRRHGVQVDLSLRRLQQPGAMVDLGAIDPSAIFGVEAVSLDEEVLERSGLRRHGVAEPAV